MRMLIALIAVAVGATIISGMITVYREVPQQLGREFRAYGANLLIIPEGDAENFNQEKISEVKKILQKNEIIGATPFLYKYYFWQQDVELQKAIPQIIGSYAAFPYIGFVIGAGFTYLCAKSMKVETSHGSAAFATAEEISDVAMIVGVMVMSFLSSPDMDLKELFTYMKNYPHISPEEFLEMPDENGIPRMNPLKEIYGEYVQNLRPFARIFGNKKIKNLEDVRRETLLQEIK